MFNDPFLGQKVIYFAQRSKNYFHKMAFVTQKGQTSHTIVIVKAPCISLRLDPNSCHVEEINMTKITNILDHHVTHSEKYYGEEPIIIYVESLF